MSIKITPQCNFDCEMIVALDASLKTKEIRKIYKESLGMNINKKYYFVSLSNFRNAAGQSIGEFLLEKHQEFVFDLMQNEE